MYARVLRKWSLNERIIKISSNCRNYDNVVTKHVTLQRLVNLNEPPPSSPTRILTTKDELRTKTPKKNRRHNTKPMSLMWLIVALTMLLLFMCTPVNVAASAIAITVSATLENPPKQMQQQSTSTTFATTTSSANLSQEETAVTAAIENVGHIVEEESYIIPVVIDDHDNDNDNDDDGKDNNSNHNSNLAAISKIYSNRLINTLSSASSNNKRASNSSSNIIINKLNLINNNIRYTNISTSSNINGSNSSQHIKLSTQQHTANSLAYSYYRRKLAMTAHEAVTKRAAYAHRQQTQQTKQQHKIFNIKTTTTPSIIAIADFDKQQIVPKVENSQNSNLLINSYKYINTNIYEEEKSKLINNNNNNNKNNTMHSIAMNVTSSNSPKMRRHIIKQQQQQQRDEKISSSSSSLLLLERLKSEIPVSTNRTPPESSLVAYKLSLSNDVAAATTTTAAPFRYLIESFEVPISLPYNNNKNNNNAESLSETRRRMLLHQQQQAARNRRDSRTFGTMQKYQTQIIGDFNDNENNNQQQSTSFSNTYDINNNNNNNNNNNYRSPHFFNTPNVRQQFQRLQQTTTTTNINNNRNFQQQQPINYQNHYFQQQQYNHQRNQQQLPQQQQQQHHANYQYQQHQHQIQHHQQQQHHQHQTHTQLQLQQQLQQQHYQHSSEMELRNQSQSSPSIRRSHRRYSTHQRKHGRRYCSARDPAQLAFEAPTVFEGKIISMTSDRRANFSVTVKVKEVFKQQIGYMLQKYVRLRFAYRNNSGECDIYREQLRTRGLVRGDELEQGLVYLIFVRQIDLGNFTILGQPIRKTRRAVEAVKEAVSENYAQFASIRSITASNRTVENGKELRIICKVQGRPPPKVTWFKDHKSINRNRKLYQFIHYKKRSELIIRSFNGSDAGRYECRAKNKVNRNLERRTIVIKAYPVPRYDTQSTGGTGNNCPDNASEFCFNGGTCKFFSEISSYSCICPEGFIGERCDRKEVNSMPPSTYSNEQECGEKKFLGSYYC